MRKLLVISGVLATMHSGGLAAHADTRCTPLGMPAAELRKAYQGGFNAVSREQMPDFLLAITPCLYSLDPFFRDRIAYEGSATLLRREAALDETLTASIRSLKSRLLTLLAGSSPDPDGVARPFAVLLLAEVARTDRVSPWMDATERRELVATANTYLMGLNDYRAFENGVGFRHGVAHAADLILQLALNTEIFADDLLPLVGAVGAKIAPSDGIAYVTGEPGRLARALLYLMLRSDDSEQLSEAIHELLAALGSPEPYADWASVFESEAALRFRHNRRAFAEALYARMGPHAEHELIAPFRDTLALSLESIP